MKREVYIDENPGVRESVMRDMRERFGYDADDTSNDEKILKLDGVDFLEEYLSWNGICGYSDMIIDAIHMAFGISLEDESFDRDIERKVEKWQYD